MAVRNDLGRVREVLRRNRTLILSTYHAVGVGIGKDPADRTSFAIIVYLPRPGEQPRTRVTIEGVPLSFLVTGQFKPHG
jgi:hypothetical protein